MTERYDHDLTLRAVAQPIYECLRCAFCFDLSWLGPANLCPAYAWGAFESYGARGRIALARALLEGELEYDATVAERVFACTECRACSEHCFKYIDTVAVFARLREDLVARGLIPPGLAAATDDLAETHNLYGEPHERRLAWLKDRSRVDRAASVAFFVGCTPAYVRRSLAHDTYAVLEASGLAGCMRTFREDVPAVLGEPLPFEVAHVTEEIARQVEAGRLRFDVYRSGTVVTYHDPCTLGRGLGVYDAPRAIIEAMPGMRLQEMPRHGRDSYCCGAGSFVRYDFSGLTDRTGDERLREAEATGAQVLLTACPACVTQFQQVRGRLGASLQVMDLVSLVRRLGRWR